MGRPILSLLFSLGVGSSQTFVDREDRIGGIRPEDTAPEFAASIQEACERGQEIQAGAPLSRHRRSGSRQRGS